MLLQMFQNVPCKLGSATLFWHFIILSECMMLSIVCYGFIHINVQHRLDQLF